MANVEEFDKKQLVRRFDGDLCDVAVSLLTSQLGDQRKNTEKERILLNLFGLVFIKGHFNLRFPTTCISHWIQLYVSICVVTEKRNLGRQNLKTVQIINHIKKYTGGQNILDQRLLEGFDNWKSFSHSWGQNILVQRRFPKALVIGKTLHVQ